LAEKDTRQVHVVPKRIGSAGDITGNNNTYWNSSLMNNVAIRVGATGYDIIVDSVTLASGLAFRDSAAGGLSTIEFSTNGQRFTGGAFDNMLVSQIPEPSTIALLGLGMGCLLLGRRR
ncbi:MAG: PEP-CTERM sorting domain-containing protein, partial [Luteolibacter sp.]